MSTALPGAVFVTAQHAALVATILLQNKGDQTPRCRDVQVELRAKGVPIDKPRELEAALMLTSKGWEPAH